MDRRRVRADREGVPQGVDGLGRPPLFAQIRPEVAPGIGQVRVELDRLLVVEEGVVLAAGRFQRQPEGVVGLGVPRLDLEGLVEFRLGLGRLPVVRQGEAEVVQRPGVVRAEGQGLPEGGHGVGQPAVPGEHVAEPHEPVGVRRLGPGDAAETLGRRVEFAGGRVDQPEVEGGGRVPGVAGQAGRVLPLGVGEFVGPAVEVAEVEVGVRVAGLGDQGPAVAVGRFGEVAGPDEQGPEVAEGGRVGRVVGQNEPVQPFGGREVAGLVAGDGRGEPLGHVAPSGGSTNYETLNPKPNQETRLGALTRVVRIVSHLVLTAGHFGVDTSDFVRPAPGALLPDVRQQGHEPGPLDGPGDGPLVRRTQPAPLAAEELALARDELFHARHVLVIHERRPRAAFLGAEPAPALAAA